MGVKLRKVFGRVLTILVLLALTASGVVAFAHRQQINDHLAAQNFDPSPAVSALTHDLALTEAGHRVFWASEPTLEHSQFFNEQCAQVGHAGGHVLGCYVENRIHLFDIADERLNGIVEVTAAHELLHAVFERMGTNDRSTLAKKLNDFYDEIEAEDPALTERMSVYSGLSKIAFANELHSVLGTEFRELPGWLEHHYETWFTDRGVILDYFDDYHAVFDEVQSRSSQLQADMKNLRADVEARSDEYHDAVEEFNVELAEYTDEVNEFNNEWERVVLRAEVFVTTEELNEIYARSSAFEQWRESLAERRESLNSQMARLNEDIAKYEDLRSELLALSDLNRELENQLDSDLAPPTLAPSDDA